MRAIRPYSFLVVAFAASVLFPLVANSADPIEIVALGASNTYGTGVDPSDSFPSQLEAMLKSAGFSIHIVSAGKKEGDTTQGMLDRMDAAISPNTRILLLQAGGGDYRSGVSDSDHQAHINAITDKAKAKGITVIMVDPVLAPIIKNYHQSFPGDLSVEGHRQVAAGLLPEVEGALKAIKN